jgi:hypothetical protein
VPLLAQATPSGSACVSYAHKTVRGGGTREQYEEVAARLTDGRGLSSLGDWPQDGILANAPGPTNDGWRVVDVWEPEATFSGSAR